jgi:cupin 2 domain-containing protein
LTGSNIFSNLPDLVQGEDFEELLCEKNILIERIVSSDRPEPTLYDQEQDEWVLLLQGHATLEVKGKAVELQTGDYLFIPARTPHRVLATSRDPQCVWLAVHVYG